MKNIFKIYFSDLKKVFTNRVAVVIILAICILPSLYAWFYLKSSRDPYGNTKGLKVAVVNNDEWVVFEWNYINIGKEIVDELKENDNIWRVFVDEDVAQEGTRLWKYYANIVIESWFSQKFITFLDEEPQNPVLDYTVNEKINAIVPKITNQWTSTIKENIEKQFIRTVDEVVMSKMNEIWLFVKGDQRNIYEFIDVVHNIKNNVYELNWWVDWALDAAYTSRNRLQTINWKIPNVYDSIDDGRELLSDTMDLTQDTSKFLNSAPKTIKKDLSTARSNYNKINKEVSNLMAIPEKNKSTIYSGINAVTWDVSKLRNEVAQNMAVLTWIKAKLQDLSTQYPFVSAAIWPIDQILSKYESMEAELNKLDKSLADIQKDVNDFNATKKSIRNNLSDISRDFDSISDDIDRELIPEFQNVLDQLYNVSSKWTDVLDDLESDMPTVQQDINSGMDVLDTTIDRLEDLKKWLPSIQWNISQIDNGLQAIKNDWVISKFLDIALLDPSRIAEFFSAPVELVEHKLFPIPNYWSAMSPFFTVLAIWVWGLLMMALFTTRVKESFLHCKETEKFFGKWLFFLTISIAQWLIVSLWEVIILWVYVHNLWAFILTTIVCSIVFSMIAFACVYAFWNAGKALLIIFLVLQLSWSGWTFPVEMSDPFFQAINPYLPFTYAIKAMREAIGWVVPQIFYANLSILLWFFWIFAIVWLLISPYIIKPIMLFDKKFAESELWE